MTRPLRPRRVQLAVPGSSERMMLKASQSAADHVFLDLEDAVAHSEKVASRAKVIEALKTHDWTNKTRCVRINDLTTEYCYGDIIEIVEQAGDHLDTIMVPKVMTAADVHFVATLLDQIEKRLKRTRPIGLELLIEEVEALQNVDSIAKASPRVECLILGMGDFSASMGIDLARVHGEGAYPGDLWHYARFRLVMACRAAKIDPVDGPYPEFRALDNYVQECRDAYALGFVGKWAIHPAQIEPAIAAFTPDRAAVDRARKMRDAFLEAQARGEGAAQIDGQMMDLASLRILKNVLDKADLYRM